MYLQRMIPTKENLLFGLLMNEYCFDGDTRRVKELRTNYYLNHLVHVHGHDQMKLLLHKNVCVSEIMTSANADFPETVSSEEYASVTRCCIDYLIKHNLFLI